MYVLEMHLALCGKMCLIVSGSGVPGAIFL